MELLIVPLMVGALVALCLSRWPRVLTAVGAAGVALAAVGAVAAWTGGGWGVLVAIILAVAAMTWVAGLTLGWVIAPSVRRALAAGLA